MIVIKLQGGLGNQLFQYATARALAIRHNTCVAFDTSLLLTVSYKTTNRKFELDNFNIQAKPIRLIDKLAFGLIKIPFKNYIKKLIRWLINSKNYTEINFTFDPQIFINTGKQTYLKGYFQSEFYFDHIQTELFTLIPKSKSISTIEKQIRACNAVSLHIRRGDYAKNWLINEFHGLLPVEYYHNAINYLLRNDPEIHIFVFSDDIEWSKQNIISLQKVTFVTENIGVTDYKDLILMSQCKHNIIANSSFSWWGAWLNQNPDKIVIAPKQWFKDRNAQKEVYDLLPKSWIKL